MIDTPTQAALAGNGAAKGGVAPDPQETREWLDALDGVIDAEGAGRASELVRAIVERAATRGVRTPAAQTTPYVNTISAEEQAHFPGDDSIESKIRHYVRWNAMAMVVRAQKDHSDLGGHVASFSSAATLYDVGFNHFWRAPGRDGGGDLVYFQGHSAPGVYARAFLEGRLSEEQLVNFRREVDGGGLSSYPHPWLMPDFWQFPTVSMGLGPLMAIYQARFMRYLKDRGLADTSGRKVWGFLGDGEADEPESLGAIGMAAREKLDNLIFIVNCNLQRLDGPVRGNGKIIQELEGVFRGAGWNVIKVIWGSRWDPLLAADHTGTLVKLMAETLDGDYQTLKSRDGAYVRENFFGKYPGDARARRAHDRRRDLGAQPRRSRSVQGVRGVQGRGRPPRRADRDPGQDDQRLRDGLGRRRDEHRAPAEETAGRAAARVPRPFLDPDLRRRDRGRAVHQAAGRGREAEYLKDRIAKLGSVPARRRNVEKPLAVPQRSAFSALLESTGEREISTTMAFVRALSTMLRDKTVGPRVVPIVADESRTFGMEGMFRQLGIYSHVGQLYRPQDADQLMWYREDKAGQILQEGINEAGAISSWIAAGTSYSTHGVQMMPFYIFYSMFGFQRVGDLAWAAGDMRSRGFLLGGTSGRTTLNGEGLQHEDGHSHLFAAAVPNCVPYDPTYAYEVATIVQDGVRRMLAEQEDVYYYITLLNENYEHPAMPAGAEDGIVRGMYLLRDGGRQGKGQPRVQLMGSGSILREVLAAAELLRDDWGVIADVWSATSFTLLHRDGESAYRWNMLHPGDEPRLPYVRALLDDHDGPVIAASDYVKTFAEQIRPFVGMRQFHAFGHRWFRPQRYAQGACARSLKSTGAGSRWPR